MSELVKRLELIQRARLQASRLPSGSRGEHMAYLLRELADALEDAERRNQVDEVEYGGRYDHR